MNHSSSLRGHSFICLRSEVTQFKQRLHEKNIVSLEAIHFDVEAWIMEAEQKTNNFIAFSI